MKRSTPSYIIVFFSVILFCSLVLTLHVITTSSGGTSYSVDEDIVNVYNITVNNTDTLLTANITQVNITLPLSFAFVIGTNATDAGTHTFINTSTVLSWDNDGLVMNLTNQSFSFNASFATSGNYNFTVTTTNVTASYITNISVTVNDTTASDVTSLIPAINSVFNVSNVIEIAANVSDDVLVDIVLANITYPNGTINQFTLSNVSSKENGLDAKFNVSFTIPNATGIYNITIIANDTSNNINSSETSNFTVNDITAPVWITATNWSTYNNQSVAILLNATDNVAIANYTVNDTTNFQVNSSNYLVNITALNSSVYLLNLTVNDTSGNEAYRTVSVTMTAIPTTSDDSSDDSSSSSSSGGGSVTKSLPLDELLENVKYNIRYNFDVGNESHYLYLRGVDRVNNEAKIDFYSFKTTVLLEVNESKNIDLDADGTYDIVALVSKIYTGRTAIDLTVNLFGEAEPGDVNTTFTDISDRNESSTEDATEDTGRGIKRVFSNLWIWVVVILAIVLGLVWYFYFRKSE